MTDTTPHRATAEQWDALASLTGVYPGAWGDCILELRSRVEALEVRDREDSDAWTGVRRANSELRARVEALEADTTKRSAFELSDDDPIPQRPATAWSLVDQVAMAIGLDSEPLNWHPEARRAIRVVAAALNEWQDSDSEQLLRTTWEAVRWLEQEAQQ